MYQGIRIAGFGGQGVVSAGILKRAQLPYEIRQKIREVCEKNLAKYSWPYEYEFRKELPKTLVGKVAFTQLIEEEKAKNTNKEKET